MRGSDRGNRARLAGGTQPPVQVAAPVTCSAELLRNSHESSLVLIGPAGETSDRVLEQLEKVADRLAATLDKGDGLLRKYEWKIE